MTEHERTGPPASGTVAIGTASTSNGERIRNPQRKSAAAAKNTKGTPPANTANGKTRYRSILDKKVPNIMSVTENKVLMRTHDPIRRKKPAQTICEKMAEEMSDGEEKKE